MENNIILPSPIIDEKEDQILDLLLKRYNELMKPGVLKKAGDKAVDLIPDQIKDKIQIQDQIKEVGKNAAIKVQEQEIFKQCMMIVAEGFGILEKNAAKFTISPDFIVEKVNQVSKEVKIYSLEEICLVRGYDISRLVNQYRTKDLVYSALEGGVTGAFGFAGLPFNIVLSTFLYYRAVQSIALYYGYDVINDPNELVIASDVFMKALSPESKGANEVVDLIGKFMAMAEVSTLKQMSKKTWQEMAERGGTTLLICQMRALANKAAKKALEKAGKKGLENNLFRNIFEQMGRKLTQKAVGKSVPFVGAAIGAGFDVVQMNKILEYADVFYNKRFLLEKEARIQVLIGNSTNISSEIIDIDVDDVQ